jgi:hypothetical protein
MNTLRAMDKAKRINKRSEIEYRPAVDEWGTEYVDMIVRRSKHYYFELSEFYLKQDKLFQTMTPVKVPTYDHDKHKLLYYNGKKRKTLLDETMLVFESKDLSRTVYVKQSELLYMNNQLTDLVFYIANDDNVLICQSGLEYMTLPVVNVNIIRKAERVE